MAGILAPPPGLTAALAAAPAPQPATFARLREELVLEPGPALRGGSPTWTLYDPASHRFYRIGWLEFEILCRWHLRSAEAIAAHIARETTLRPEVEQVEQFGRFLQQAELLCGGDATGRFVGRKRSARQGWLSWLVHHYLFVRIPLGRPDRPLAAILPSLSWVYTRAFLVTTVLAAALGVYLTLRQWDSFSQSFLWFFSLEGAAIGGAALIAAKLLHELGHGLTAKRFGCPVPSMGIALMVLMPVLYTDTSAAWRVRERHKRLAIGAAGVAAECCLAVYALLAWNFLPDGLLRSVVFMWATTTWVLTVFINMSPFMRFDGYYLLSDLLDIPNLQDRAFALTRHRLRELLFGFGEAPPEVLPPDTARLMVLYAVTTWIYRFFLFVGIALVVYHMFFKLLGVVLFAIELWWFIARPVVREIGEWVKRRGNQRMNLRTVCTLTLFGGLLAAILVPWRTAVHAPAMMAARERVQLFSQVPGRLAAVLVSSGDRVEKDAPLVAFESPDILFKVEQAARRVASLQAQVRAESLDQGLHARSNVLAQQLEGARAEHVAALAQRDRLTIRAPMSGTVTDLAEPLGRGEWIKPGELIGVVADFSGTRIEAYIAEADLGRIALGRSAEFVPSDPAVPRVPATVAEIDSAAVRALSDAELASVHGGMLATRVGANRSLVPEQPVYRVRLVSAAPVRLQHTRTGTVIFAARPESIAVQAWQRVLSIAIRESGF